jgi:hypothetical protein
MAEQHTNKRQRYHKYKRGQFVIVRFGKRIGTEFSGTHPAIVISKEDNLFSGNITVIPLTSKYHSQYLELGELLNKSVYRKLGKGVAKELFTIKEVRDILDTSENLNEAVSRMSELNLPVIKDYIKYYQQLTDKYESMFKQSYAIVSQITTISKSKIVKPINKLDLLNELIISNSTLDKIDSELLYQFTRSI